ncbi:MAG TPA: enoyl-CoA hydratase [Alphaproteobacteria bacterium]|nr:enoyl-CoA hydratase [Alphaproteobacteria bacterium]HCO92286.1 enoyl-CoA hydratase [Alphaproteobacteria bacterium]
MPDILKDNKTIAFEMSGNVATITLNRPDAANGVDLEMGHGLMQAAIHCDETPGIRAVILTGAGKMFCAGGDLKAFAGFGDTLPARLKELTAYLHAATSRFMRMDAPLIVAVNGTAAGAGFSLAVSGDLVLAAASANFTMAYTAAGLSPDGSSSYFLPRLIGLRRTQELMLTNRRLDAAAALDWGLVTEIVPDEQLLPAATTLAQKLADGPTRAHGVVKRLLIDSYGNGPETQMELEARGIAAMAGTEDGREGIAAFLAKRAPRFTGK